MHLRLSCLLMALGATLSTMVYAEGTLILDETAYCRAYVQFGCDRISPAALRKAAEDKLLNEGELKRLRGKNPDEAHWQDSVYQSYAWLQYGGDRNEADRHIYTPMPPADWVKPEFDDTRWLYQKKPLMVMKDFWAEHYFS